MSTENPQYLILIYSKYSSQCQRLVQVLASNPIEYIKLLCIDNSKARQRILESKKLSIHTVPCILLVYSSNIEKFEGSNVTDWVLSQIANNTSDTKTDLVYHSDNADNTGVDIGATSLDALLFTAEEEESPQALIPQTKKSISEIAAEMAGERDKMNPQNPNIPGGGLAARPV